MLLPCLIYRVPDLMLQGGGATSDHFAAEMHELIVRAAVIELPREDILPDAL